MGDPLYHIPVNSTAGRVISRISPEETEREALVRQVQDLERAIKAAKLTKAFPKSHVEELGRQKLALQMKIREIKDFVKTKHRDSIHFHFMEACREGMSKPEFNKWLKAAVLRREEHEQKEHPADEQG